MEGLRDRQGEKLMVILFWANWYPECEDLRETLEKIAENLQHIIICWVSLRRIDNFAHTFAFLQCDVLTEKEIVDHFEVTIIPYITLMHVSNCRY